MKIVTVVGARPQFIKLAPLIEPLAGRFESVLVHTGQHYDEGMSDQFFHELRLPRPQHHLGVGSAPHGAQTGRMLERVEEILLQESPDVLLVFGDTNSTLAGALAAAKLHIPVAHVEAGMRCFDMRVPEEVNRVLTDHLARWNFASCQTAVDNLARESITSGVHLVGDIMVDSLRRTLTGPPAEPAPEGDYLLLTMHRAEMTPEGLESILTVLREHGQPVLFPCHPRTLQLLRQTGLDRLLADGPVRLLPPAGHRQILAWIEQANLVLTDSGGLQKEAYLLKTPCLTLRDETEWVETVAVGWNTLVGHDRARIQAGLSTRPPAEHPELYGDGHTAERILDVLAREAVPSKRAKETV